jgi:O-antigen/teichoic acid export membrane protein
VGSAARLRLAGTLALGQLAGRGGLAVALLLLIRDLPVRDFGILAVVLAIVSVMATVADAGFARLIVRDVSRGGPDAGSLVSELMRVRSLAVGVIVLLCAVALALVPTSLPGSVVVLALAYLALEATAYGFESAAIGSERPWRFVAAQSLAAAALLGGVIGLSLANSVTLPSAMAVLVLASTIKVGSHLLAWRRRGRSVPSVPRRAIRSLLRQSMPFFALALMATVYYRIGVVALYGVRGAQETASYAAAFRVVDVVAVLAGLAFSGVSPALSRLHRDRPDQIWNVWLRMVGLSGMAVVPPAVLALLFAEPLCELLFGPDYREAAGADLRLLVPAIVLMVPQALSAAVVFMADEHSGVLALTAINVSVCVAASIVGAQALGSEGAALALSCAEALSFVTFALLISHRYRGVAMPRVPRPPAGPLPPPV